MSESYFTMDPGADQEAVRPALCIINYNGASHLPRSLGRIRHLWPQFGEVVFIDDASTDGSGALARELLPNAHFIALPRNSGAGPARNAGFDFVRANRILFMDNDVFLGDDVLDRLGMALDESPNAVLAMPRIVTASAPDNIEYDGGDAHFSGLVALRNAGRSVALFAAADVVEVGSLITCCFLFDRARWGAEFEYLFDEEFGMYGDDHELGLRARIRGLDLLAVPRAVCLHGTGTPGLSIRHGGRHEPLRIRNTILNRWQVLIKIYQTRTLILLAPYLATFELFQLGGCVFLGWHREWMAALRKLVELLPSLGVRRRTMQTIRTRSDVKVLVGGPHPFNPKLAERALLRVTLPLLDSFGRFAWWLARSFSGRFRSR